MDPKELLSVPVGQLGLSSSFHASCEAMGFVTLADIIFLLPEQLIRKEGFSYRWLGELSAYLDEKGLLYLLQPLPGKNCD